jgi:SAM-dependent methyltransferase
MDARLYDDMAAMEDVHWWYRGRREICRRVLARAIGGRGPGAPKPRILDVGCGTGGNLPMLEELGPVDGLELNAGAAARARRRLTGGGQVFEGGLPEGLPPGRRYDVITAFDVLEHVERVEEAIAAIAAALEPGGVFVCTVPAFMFLWSEHDVANHHFRRYGKRELISQLERGRLRLRHTSYFNSWLFPAIAGVRLLKRLAQVREAGRADHDLSMPPRLLNELLARLFASERHLVAQASLPVGVSLLAIAEPAP